MKIVLFSIALLVFAGCSSSSVPPFSEFMEIRRVADDDPLATRFETVDGEEIRLGDKVISGKNISRFQFKQGEEGYDLYITLLHAEETRWRKFAWSRRPREAAMLINGKVHTVFSTVRPPKAEEKTALIVRIPAVAETEEEAKSLDNFFAENKGKKESAN